MITITLSGGGKPSNERAIAFAKALVASKKQMEEDSKAFAKTEKYQEYLRKLDELNAKANTTDV